MAAESARLCEIRLAALAGDPDAFTSTLAHEAGLPETWWDDWAARSEDGGEQRTFVLTDSSDAWLGLALVRSDEPGSRSAVINAMWVAPEARGRDGAGVLCDACAAWAKEQVFPELMLDVVVGNDPALRAYAAAGFAIRGETTWSRHGRTLHEYVMARPL